MAPLVPDEGVTGAAAPPAGAVAVAGASKYPQVECRLPEAQGLAWALAQLPSLDEKPAEGAEEEARGAWMSQIAGEASQALRSWLESKPILPEDFTRPLEGCGYARRLLCACPRGRFQAIAMTWGPGQAAPIHDHAGLWCVEGLYRGRMLTQDWEPPSPAGLAEVGGGDGGGEPAELFSFPAPGEWVEQQSDHIEAIVPPQEYHVLANPFKEPAVTIHIYGGRMSSCCTYHPEQESASECGGLHRLKRCNLCFTPTPSPSPAAGRAGEKPDQGWEPRRERATSCGDAPRRGSLLGAGGGETVPAEGCAR